MAAIDAYRIGVELMLGGDLAQGIVDLVPGLERLDTILGQATDHADGLAGALGRVAASAAGIDRTADSLARVGSLLDAVYAARPGAAGSAGALVPLYVPNFTLPPGAAPGEPADAPFHERVPPIPLYPGARRQGTGQRSPGQGSGDLLSVASGVEIGEGMLRHVAEPAIEFERLLDILAADKRLSPADLAGAAGRARDTTDAVQGSTATDNLRALLDLKTVFGSLSEAEGLLPGFQSMTRTLELLDRKKGGGGDQAVAAARAMEIMGEMISERAGPNGETVREMDPERGLKYLTAMQQVAIATEMRVAPKDFLALAKQARVAGLTLDDDFVYTQLPALMQTQGASRTGTALMSMAQVFAGGKLSPASLEAMTKIGLAGPDGVFDREMLGHNPLDWVTAASKRMDAKGIHGTEAQVNALMSASQRVTIAGVLASLLKDAPAIRKESDNIRNTDPGAGKLNTSAAASVLQFQSAMENMQTAIGGAGLGDAARGLNELTAALNGIAHWAGEHPDGTRAALEGLAFGLVALAAEKVASALAVMGGSGRGSLYMMAGGILALSGALDHFPAWLQDAAKGAVVGGSIAGLPGAAAGAAAGSLWNLNPWGLNDVTPGQALHGLGHLLHLNAYHPVVGEDERMMQPIHIVFEADGDTLSRVVTRHQLRRLGGQMSGTVRPDPSIAPQYGSYIIET